MKQQVKGDNPELAASQSVYTEVPLRSNESKHYDSDALPNQDSTCDATPRQTK